MNDWIGTPKPVKSSAPPWPRHWRKWWDPRAPSGTGGGPSDPPVVDKIPDLVPENPPTVTGTGSPGCQIWIIITPDGSSYGVEVDQDGNWSFTFPKELPVGDYCIEVRQRCEDPGGWSDPPIEQCFSVVEITQTIDFETKGLRFDSANGWPVRGTLAYKINGQWVYGVLRRAVKG